MRDGSGLKTVEGPKEIKAFAAKVASGKKKRKGVLARIKAKLGFKSTTSGNDNAKTTNQILQRKGPKRYPLKVLRSVSIPKMFEMVYDGRSVTESGLKKEIEEMYHKNVEAEIGKVLATQ